MYALFAAMKSESRVLYRKKLLNKKLDKDLHEQIIKMIILLPPNKILTHRYLCGFHFLPLNYLWSSLVTVRLQASD